MGRDHSIECDVCHFLRGGFDDLPCACDMVDYNRSAALTTLAANLHAAALLCDHYERVRTNVMHWMDGRAVLWRPNAEGRGL